MMAAFSREHNLDPNRRFVADSQHGEDPTRRRVFLEEVGSLSERGQRSLRSDLAIDALQMAIYNEGGTDSLEGLIHHSDRGVQGGFKWSSQHLSAEVFDGTATWVDGDVDGASGDAVAGPAASAPRCRAQVLGEDCRGFVERGRSDGVWCLGSGWFSLVPRSWWDAIDSTQSAVRQVSDVC